MQSDAYLSLVSETPELREERWEEVMQLTQEMLRQAEAGLWQTLMDTEAQRRGLLEAIFASPPALEEASFLLIAINQLLSLDEKINVLLVQAREECAGQLNKIQLGRQMLQAYVAQER